MTDVVKSDRLAWRTVEANSATALQDTLNALTMEGYTIRDIIKLDETDLTEEEATPTFVVVAFDPVMIISGATTAGLDKMLESLMAKSTPQAPTP